MSSKKRIDDAKESLIQAMFDSRVALCGTITEAISELIDAKIADYESRKGNK